MGPAIKQANGREPRGWSLFRAPIRHPGLLVRIRGLEPPLPCENMDLNHARLPIPPYPHMLVGLFIF